MTRFLSTAAAVAALGGAFGSAGCMNSSRESLQSRYSEKVDPCTPERYSFAAREAALAPFEAHVNNGHILDQFLQNGDFDAGAEALTPGGRVKLDQLARKRPVDGHLYMQTARDLPYDAAKPGDYARISSDLNVKRANAMVAYLNATTSGRGLAFDVTVIDPADLLMPASGPANSVRGLPGRYASGIGGIASNNSVGVGGAAAVTGITPNLGGAAGAAPAGPSTGTGGQTQGGSGMPR